MPPGIQVSGRWQSWIGSHGEFDRTFPRRSLLVGLTLSGVKGWKVLQEPYGFHDLDGAFDRDFVSVPETELSDLTTPVDIALRPLFDFIWNGGGWPGSPNYREGRWVKPS